MFITNAKVNKKENSVARAGVTHKTRACNLQQVFARHVAKKKLLRVTAPLHLYSTVAQKCNTKFFCLKTIYFNAKQNSFVKNNLL